MSKIYAMLSTSEENYLKAIYKIGQMNAGHPVLTNTISAELGTTAASVTDMVKKLADKKFLTHEKYYGVILSKEGQKTALDLLRRHRLWETFLHNNLGFGWEEVHELAEQLEHIQSKKLTDRLDAFLGHPKFDPHGDPIPNEQGSFTYRNQITLNSIQEVGKKLIMIAVKNQDVDFLKYLNNIQLKPGAVLEIVSIGEYDRSYKIRINQKEETVLTFQVANEIIVKP